MQRIVKTARIPIQERLSDLRCTLTQFRTRTTIELRRFRPDGRPTGSGIAFTPKESPSIRAILESFERMDSDKDNIAA